MLKNVKAVKFPFIVFLTILLFMILILSLILGEIDYNYGEINIILVYLFFLATVLIMLFYLQSKHKTRFLDVILIFIIAFSLAHLFISRGPTFVGRTDIHNEYLHAKFALTSINWDPNEFEENYNTIISITIFPMILRPHSTIDKR